MSSKGSWGISRDRHRQPTGLRICLDQPRQFGDDARLRVVDADVEGEQRVEGVLVGGRQVDDAFQRVTDHRRGVDPRGADLRGIRA